MNIHHEGSAHPGSWRMLHTTKLRFYWPDMRQEISQHCAECRGCALRSKYHRQPKIPVQEYPPVFLPLGRIHIDLTGELPLTEGNGSRYIMVVKDFHTKFVWLFAIKTKDAVAIADQLVTELYCRWGIPEMLVKSNSISSQAPEVVIGIFTTATPFAGVPPVANSNSILIFKPICEAFGL